MNMARNQKKIGSELHSDARRLKNIHERNRIPKMIVLLSNIRLLIPFLSGMLQVVAGLVLISITIMGIIQPLWLSAMFSILGSITSMMGVLLLYYSFAAEHSLETLINQAIKRVINSQN